MNNYKVYQHTFPNGKVYIGATNRKHLSTRWGKNGSGYHQKSQPLMFYAIMEFGWTNIKHEVLFENMSHEEAMAKETELIAKYDSTNPDFGYNVSSGWKQPAFNRVMTAEQRAKISNARKGVKHTEEAKAKIALGNKLASQREETKRKKRESHLGKKLTPETIAKMKATCASRPKKVKAPKLPKAPEEFGKRVLQLDPTTNEVIKEWNNVKEICSTLGIAQAGVSRVCSGKYSIYKGFAWKYVPKAPKTKKIKK